MAKVAQDLKSFGITTQYGPNIEWEDCVSKTTDTDRVQV